MSDGPVALLPRRVPDLYFYAGLLEGDCFGCELDADGGFGLMGEFIFFEARE